MSKVAIVRRLSKNSDSDDEEARDERNHPVVSRKPATLDDADDAAYGNCPEIQTTVGDKKNSDEEQQNTSCTECCICLTDYEVGCKILFSTTCKHHFREQCAYTWLEKHDECPYCRQEMFTAEEMRDSAIEILGEKRVQTFGKKEDSNNQTSPYHELEYAVALAESRNENDIASTTTTNIGTEP